MRPTSDARAELPFHQQLPSGNLLYLFNQLVQRSSDPCADVVNAVWPHQCKPASRHHVVDVKIIPHRTSVAPDRHLATIPRPFEQGGNDAEAGPQGLPGP